MSLVDFVVNKLDDLKATDILPLNVKGKSSITDTMIYVPARLPVMCLHWRKSSLANANLPVSMCSAMKAKRLPIGWW